MFTISTEAKKYINNNGNQIYITMELTHSGGWGSAWCSSRAPVIRLGKPDAAEIHEFAITRIDDIDIWYETNKIMPLNPGKPIHIGFKKLLFIGWLFVEGVRKDLEE